MTPCTFPRQSDTDTSTRRLLTPPDPLPTPSRPPPQKREPKGDAPAGAPAVHRAPGGRHPLSLSAGLFARGAHPRVGGGLWHFGLLRLPLGRGLRQRADATLGPAPVRGQVRARAVQKYAPPRVSQSSRRSHNRSP
eukprot:1161790-Prorocentrum_minimum.AAC.2